ncbi:helix-turn-helix transcriptional regulator [Novosphingobium taihuense]|uniref:DNA-binding CsgD family transcriptional regulator/PAS domain-containing protein n=1 Tax=Novosphingobium taihuense TaxID=260085 RepID=A0A7W7EUK5_9SPHN|nr:helix-turn-helix transcriptional regulator [Novosphingobium taihuense]MBB4614104.1 DNA-binding CsgD family transcriptional regulator/PAS domain-containing protein [Novosphingobium taihuense]TWH86954.1 DNA-binding CsgD family transcriptional regulator [Novosphingobium taihuense]
MYWDMGGAIDEGFSDLLARLYAGVSPGVTGEQPWRAFLEALARWMEASFATLIITAPGKRQPATFLTPGSDADFDAAYTETLFAEDPFQGLSDGVVTSYAEFMADLPEGAFATYRRAMAESGFDRVLGIDLHFGGSRAGRPDDGRYEARFRISRHNSLPDFTREERARLQALAQHLRIAVTLFEKLQFAGAEHGMFHATAQGLGLALLVLDRNRRIVSSNALAESLLAQDEGFRRRGEELAFADGAHQRLVGELLADGRRGGGLTRFRIERPGHGDLVVTARPLDLSAIHAGTGALALFLASPHRQQGPESRKDPALLRELLGLTMAEARLASVLAEGMSLVEAARALGIAHNTAKVQLRAVFAKTGVHRQAQLVALLASLAG